MDLLISTTTVPVLAKSNPVRVWANIEWIDTGIEVSEGVVIDIKANGKAITGPINEYGQGVISGPEGQETICYTGEYMCSLDGAPFGALVGRVGESGTPFFIGAGPINSPESGILFLVVNDYSGTYYDNQAGFTVKL